MSAAALRRPQESLEPAPVFAFFDVDDTLIAVKSVFSFQDFWFAQENDHAGRERFYLEMNRLKADNAPWEFFNRRLCASFAGRDIALTKQRAEQWFAALEQSGQRVFNPAVVAKLRAHQQRGHQAVFLSGSFPALLAPIARRLNVNHVLAAELAGINGRYTGELLPPQTIGAGKAQALRSFAAWMGADLRECYAYGDDISDEHMLSAVGNPTAIAGGRGLEQRAAQLGWPVLQPV